MVVQAHLADNEPGGAGCHLAHALRQGHAVYHGVLGFVDARAPNLSSGTVVKHNHIMCGEPTTVRTRLSHESNDVKRFVADLTGNERDHSIAHTIARMKWIIEQADAIAERMFWRLLKHQLIPSIASFVRAWPAVHELGCERLLDPFGEVG